MSSRISDTQLDHSDVSADVVPFGPAVAENRCGSSDDRVGAARIAALQAKNAELHAQPQQARLILDSAIEYAVIIMDIDGCVTSWNAGAQQVMGYVESEILGRSGEIIFTSEDRASGIFTTELCRAIEAGRAVNERWHLRRDGTRFWASGMMMPLLNAEGQPHGFLNILRDRTEARAEVERRELLMAEMNHRIKNTFSMVQAVAVQTERHAASVGEFQAAFRARLMVLARSNDVLMRADWHDAPLREVIESALEAYNGEPGRIAVGGPAVLLAANLAVTISLAFHELATNAVKHGALSGPEGLVEVAWTIVPCRKKANRVDITRRERGGPLVKSPQRRGFGSQLLERGMPGADRAIDAVGVDAQHAHHGPAGEAAKQKKDQNKAEVAKLVPHRHSQDGNWVPGDAPGQALEWAIAALAKAGTLGIIGVYPPIATSFPIGKLMNKNLLLNAGNCNHRAYIPALIELVRAGTFDPCDIITQHEHLTDAIMAYEAFDKREAGWIKTELQPAA